MKRRSTIDWRAVAPLSLMVWTGCCCCNPAALTNRVGAPSSATAPADPAAAEELTTATEYAQKALSNLGYGEVATAALRKDDIYWYVEGQAGGKDGGMVNYMVMFQVSRYENRQTWAAKTVSINGEVVFPKGGGL